MKRPNKKNSWFQKSASANRTRENSQRRHCDFEKLEDRRLLAFDIAGVPDWVELGPGIIEDGQVEGMAAQDNPVAGAIHTLAAHPSNPDILFSGSVNGGIWRTINATATAPTWTPLTDQLPSLSISAMEFDRNDPSGNTIIAGIGAVSSSAQVSGDRIGVVYTTNALASNPTWQILEGGFVGRNIVGVAARGATLVVAASAFNGSSGGSSGVYVSNDTGASFTRLNGIGGLPFSATTLFDMVGDEGNANRVYLAAQEGIFRTENISAATPVWTNVTAASLNIDATFDGKQLTNNVEIATYDNAGTNVVYAAVIHQGQINTLSFSTNQGATWTAMDRPEVLTGAAIGVAAATNDGNPIVITLASNHGFRRGDRVRVAGVTGNTAANGDFNVDLEGLGENQVRLIGVTGNGNYTGGGTLQKIVGISPKVKPGGQGGIHFAIATDGTNPNLVYIGGDRQDGPFPNPNGADTFSGNLWRGDRTVAPSGDVNSPQWTLLTHNGTMSGSAPHADAREIVFDANGDLVEADDGGVYRRTQPQSSNGDWESVIGDLRVTEFYSIAIDTNNDIVIGGAQDVGAAEQSATGSFTWTDIRKGDGFSQDAVSNADDTSLRYMFNNGTYRRRSFNAAGNLVSDDPISFTGMAMADRSALGGFPISPFSLSQTDGRLMLVGVSGTGQIYEDGSVAGDAGDAVTNVTPAALTGNITSLVYGGNRNGTAENRLVYVGTSTGELWLRSSTNNVVGTFQLVEDFGARIMDIAVDPDDWQNVHVLTGDNEIEFATDGASFSRVTDNLGDFSSLLLSIEIYDPTPGSTAGDEILLAGGRGGVYRRLANTAKPTATWLEYGAGLPNVLVRDIQVEGNELYVGTFGRGVWAIPNVSSTIATVGSLQITGDVGNNFLGLAADANNPLRIIGNDGASIQSFEKTLFRRIEIRGLGGTDTILIDSNGSAPGGNNEFVTFEIFVDAGGNANDRLIVENSDSNAFFTQVTINNSMIGDGAFDNFWSECGSLEYAGLQNNGTLELNLGSGSDNVEFVASTANEVVLNGNGGDDELENSTGAAGTFVVDGLNAGSFNNIVKFDSIEDLDGGALADEFRFVGVGKLSGRVQGKAGNDHFNYATVNSQVITLINANADGYEGTVAGGNLVAFGFEDIDLITGSQNGTGDQLNGVDFASTWVVNNAVGSYTAAGQKLDLANFETYNGGNLVDDFNVLATSYPVQLNGNDGDDSFVLSSMAPSPVGGDVSGLNSVVNVDGGIGVNSLVASDITGNGNTNVRITDGSITGLAPAAINYTGAFPGTAASRGVTIWGADAVADTFNVDSFLASNTLELQTFGGDDMIKTATAALGDMRIDGGNGSDAVEVMLIHDTRRIDAQDSGAAGTDRLTLYGLADADNVVVRATSVARNTTDRVWHDANTENLEIMSRDGNDVFNIAGSDAGEVLVQTDDGDDFARIMNTGNTGRMEVLGGRDNDRIRVRETNANTMTIVNGQHDTDRIFVGSNLSDNDGSLDRIRGSLSVVGGNNAVGAEDRLYVNDRATLAGQIYKVTDSEITAVSARTFNTMSVSQFEVVRLDGTDQADEFQVTPSNDVRFVVDGNLPTRHDIACTDEGDFLNLVTDASSGRRLYLTDRANGNGTWGFTNGNQTVNFTSIEKFNHVERLALGSDAFLQSEVTVYDAETRELLFTLNPYESWFTGGSRVATGDVTNDGIPDIIVAPGAGRRSLVRIFDGVDGTEVANFEAYRSNLKDGVLVAVGDVGGDCGAEIITSTGPGRGHGEVRVWRADASGDYQMVDSFLPFGSDYYGGSSVAVGDFDGDGTGDIAVGALHGQAHVAVFKGGVAGGAYELSRFMAFESNFYGGVHVATGDFDGGGVSELIVSTGENVWNNEFDSHVHVYDGDNLSYTPGQFAAADFEFYAFEQNETPNASTRLVGKDHDLDGAIDELFASHGPGDNDSTVKVFDTVSESLIDSIFESSSAFDHGVFVG